MVKRSVLISSTEPIFVPNAVIEIVCPPDPKAKVPVPICQLELVLLFNVMLLSTTEIAVVFIAAVCDIAMFPAVPPVKFVAEKNTLILRLFAPDPKGKRELLVNAFVGKPDVGNLLLKVPLVIKPAA